MIVVNSFGEHIRAIREAANLSLKQVANNLHIDTSLLAKYERNERQPSKDLIIQIAQYYNIDSRYLIKEFLSFQIANKIYKEEEVLDILKQAEKKVMYLKSQKQ